MGNAHSRTSVIRRVGVALLFMVAFALPPLLVGGVGVARALQAEQAKPTPLSTALPAVKPHDPTKPTAVVVAGNNGTESSDVLGPYEELATSTKYNVYVAAPEQRPAPLFPGSVSLLPHYSFADYDATFDGKVDLLVVPYIPNTDTTDAPVLTWIQHKANAGTTILSICAGAQMVADAGVLGGQTATSHHNTLPVVKGSHPEVNWLNGVRYVDSGQFISSAGITSGVDATLYTLSREFGRDVADQTAAAMGYPHLRFIDDPTWIVPTPSLLPMLPNAYRWDPTQIGLVLFDGVREVEVGSVIDTYPHSLAADVRPIALAPGLVHTQHGLDLVVQDDLASAPRLDRVLVPGTPSAAVTSTVDQWAGARGLAAERIHAAGEYAYDATLRDMARHETNPIVQEAATGIEYPQRDLHLNGPEVRLEIVLRPLALGLLGLSGLLLLRSRQTPAFARRPAT